MHVDAPGAISVIKAAADAVIPKLYAFAGAGSAGRRVELHDFVLCDWVRLCMAMGIGSQGVAHIPDFGAVLINHRALGWRIYYNRSASLRSQCRYHCHEATEFLMAHCPCYGIDCYAPGQEAHGAQFRHRIAALVVDLVFGE